MKASSFPKIWIILLVIVLPQLTETVYTPSLTAIRTDLKVPAEMVEYTLSMFLLGFSVGMLLWGTISDTKGRKPCLLIGMSVYALGCLGCYFSDSVELLLFWRFVQALGGSSGSVLGNAITRDAFQGPERGKVFATVFSVMALSPALGPIVGGTITQIFSWHYIFIFLCVGALFAIYSIVHYLPETLQRDTARSESIATQIGWLMRDKKVKGFAFMVGCPSGIGFSYYAEGPFYLIEILGISPTSYSMTFLFLASTWLVGGYLCKRLQGRLAPINILKFGIFTSIAASIIFSSSVIAYYTFGTPGMSVIMSTIFCMMLVFLAITLIIPSSKTLALDDHQGYIGTATAVFGFMYYTVASLISAGMAVLRDGSLIPMPLYFLGISFAMWVAYQTVLRPEFKTEPPSGKL